MWWEMCFKGEAGVDGEDGVYCLGDSRIVLTAGG